MTGRRVIVWDLETVPDFVACRQIRNMQGVSDGKIRDALVMGHRPLPWSSHSLSPPSTYVSGNKCKSTKVEGSMR